VVSGAVGGQSATLWLGENVVAEWTKVDFDGKGKMIDVSSVENANFEQFIAGKRGATLTIEVLFVPGDVVGQFALMNAWLTDTLLADGTIPMLTRASGGPNISGNAYVENFEWKAPDNEKQTATFTLRFTGFNGICWH
jgi:hypothetical protein